jgi:excisionase family DNA binding protein
LLKITTVSGVEYTWTRRYIQQQLHGRSSKGGSMTNRSGTASRTVSVEEAARTLGIGRSLAYELARTGELPALRLGNRLVVPVERLERLLAGDEHQRDDAA